MNLSTRIFDDYLPSLGAQAFAPFAAEEALKVDIAESAKGYTVTADVPGYARSDLAVEFSDGVLKLEARAATAATEAEAKDQPSYLYKERSRGRRARSFRFADEVNGKKIDAKLADGVLEVFVPKAASPAQRTVEIK